MRSKQPALPCPTESAEQRTLFMWAALQSGKYPELTLLHHIPNGGSRNPIEAKNLKAQGVKPGVPDICLPVPRGGYTCMYIELKRKKGGVVSREQRQWMDGLARHGAYVVVCRGSEEAERAIMDYLRGKAERSD